MTFWRVMPTCAATAAAEPGSTSSASSRARIGSSATAAAAGSSITSTSCTGAIVAPDKLICQWGRYDGKRRDVKGRAKSDRVSLTHVRQVHKAQRVTTGRASHIDRGKMMQTRRLGSRTRCRSFAVATCRRLARDHARRGRQPDHDERAVDVSDAASARRRALYTTTVTDDVDPVEAGGAVSYRFVTPFKQTLPGGITGTYKGGQLFMHIPAGLNVTAVSTQQPPGGSSAHRVGGEARQRHRRDDERQHPDRRSVASDAQPDRAGDDRRDAPVAPRCGG